MAAKRLACGCASQRRGSGGKVSGDEAAKDCRVERTTTTTNFQKRKKKPL